MSRIFFTICTLLLIVAFTPSKTQADPIIITSGSLTVTGLSGGPQYTLFGDNFSTGGAGEQGSVALQSGFAISTSGSVVNVNALFTGSSLGDNHGGTFTFSGPPITIPFGLTNLTLTSPFTFSGFLITCQASCFNSPPISSFSLVGGGTATFELLFSGLNQSGVPIFTFGSITYNFEVPEPASIMLLGGGLAALTAALRRRFRQTR